MKLATILTIVGGSVLLNGCQYALNVSASGTAENLAIDLKEESFFAKSAPSFGDVSLISGENGHWKTHWLIMSTGSNCGPPTSHFKYGEVPSGFHTEIPPEPLQNGIDYELDIGRCGEIGAANFRFENGRIVGIQRPQ